MKSVYIAPFKDGTGYSKAAIEYIMALDSVGVDVVPRAIRMTPTDGPVPDRINELEKLDVDNVDVIIQHNLPDNFVYKNGALNVGIFAYETSGFPNTNWKAHLRLMDKIIVSCEHQKGAIVNTCGSKMADKVSVVPHALDTDKFDKTYEKLDFGLAKNTFKFYTISEFNRRKNLAALLAAYYSEFDASENVALVVKTHVGSRNGADGSNVVKNLIAEIKNGIRRFVSVSRYPRVIILTDYLDDEEINQIHTSCDVFVTASHGEAFCIPAFDALGFGKQVIAPNYSVFKDYPEFFNLVDGVEAPVFGVVNAPPKLYTADELWFNPNIKDLAKTMRSLYDNKDSAVGDLKDVIKSMFSRQAIGTRFKQVLENAE
jgi:glycosyltransferase involved in cell wall biosynthesis